MMASPRSLIVSVTRLCLLLFCLVSLPVSADNAAYQTDPYPFTRATDAARFTTLTKEIRCVVCQHQSIADSNAPLAEGLRLKVYDMIKNNQSDAEIKAYLVKRYGEFILLEPRVSSRTALLWLFPVIALVLGGGFLIRFFRAGKSQTSPTK